MDSNEEYLDQLLKSLTEGTSTGAADGTDDSDQDNGLGDLLNQFSDDMDSVPQELFSGLLGDTETVPEEQPGQSQGDEPTEEQAILSGMIQDMAGQDSDEPVELVKLKPEEEQEEEPAVFDVPEQEISEISEQSDEEISELSDPEPNEQTESDMAWETEFDMFKDPEPDMNELSESGISEAEEPDMPVQPEPELSLQTESDMEQPESANQETDDLGSLLESLGADGQEISDLLDKAERDEPVEDMVDSLMQELNEELSPDARYAGESNSDEMAELLERPGKKRKKKEKVKKERVKKEKRPRGRKRKEGQDSAVNLPEDVAAATDVSVEDDVDSTVESIMANITGDTEDDAVGLQQEAEESVSAEPAAEEKKQGFWSKLLNALTQEEESGEEPAELISDENGAILEELDKEKKQAKGKKKKGKDKDKGKKAAEMDEDEELDESADSKGKKKKEKKPKKEKPPVPVEDLLPGKKLSLKKILPLMLVVLVFGLAYILVSHLYIDYVNKQGAERAYYAGDYMECYSLLFGQDLNDNQELMYHRSELALQMERMKGNYRRLVMEGRELEALDYLVQCVRRKETSYVQGQKWNCLDIVEETYAGMSGLLTANYGLSEERAMEIAALKSDVDYTLALIEVLEKLGSDPEEANEQQETPISYEDWLPEEEENSDTEFVDTMG